MTTTTNQSPTDPSIVDALNKHMNEVIDMLSDLRGRWDDEWQYESFSEYSKVIVDKLKSVITDADDVKASQWKVSFRLPNNRWYSYYISGSRGGWKRIK